MSHSTHEQDVVSAKARIGELKAAYMRDLIRFRDADPKDTSGLQTAALDCLRSGTSYFNYAEEFVGTSDLLGAWRSRTWAKGFAEDCAAILGSLPGHIEFLRAAFCKAGLPIDEDKLVPGRTAYAGMQRMVKRYLTSDEATRLKQQLEEHQIPTCGFRNGVSKRGRILLGGLLFAIICGGLATRGFIQARKAIETTSVPRPAHRSYYQVKGHPERVIVFIHGIFGSSDDTWNYSPTTSWPDLIKGDPDPSLQNTDIYMAGYDTPYIGNTMSIDEIVSNLQSRLESDRVFEDHRNVVIVAHSLGGLIIQRFLLTYRDHNFAKKVNFIYFYATPQTGAQIAKLGAVMSADPLLEQMIPNYQDNNYLRNLEREWQHSGFSIPRYCAYEKKPYNHVLIVDEMSGTRNCTSSVAINEDHVSIVKPADRDADSYIAFRNEMRKLPTVRAHVKSIDQSANKR